LSGALTLHAHGEPGEIVCHDIVAYNTKQLEVGDEVLPR
jgi:hypothetical protein